MQTANEKVESMDSGAQQEQLRTELVRKITAHIREDGKEPTAVPGLSLYRKSAPSECTSAAYEPELIVFVQGEKRINVGGNILVCDGSTMLLSSIDLPVVSQVSRATVDEPILGLTLKLEMPVVREILSQDEFLVSGVASATRGMVAGKTPVELLSACVRLLDLLDKPADIPFLGSLMQREILYRLLRSPLGKHLRAIATLGEQSNRTAKAVAWLKTNYSKPLRVEDLASVAQMGVSTFHHQFRSLTAMSPLQYQKRLRLHVARVRMLTEGLDAASAAFEVGYESASQFNREYSRLFGQPPMRDIKSRRLTGAADGLEALQAS
ncbi:MAG: AraC family transcriptional regulator [Terracidiphilus sp.]|nr:AraC family transcriptional regulator [Terracidiphilus sp.]MDR3776561.1 AraC family transcriptional regulator [Terracidiphilus sp.]